MTKKLLWTPLSSINFSKNTEKILTHTNNEINENTLKLRDHQKLISRYLNVNSPYRGLLLFHGLGSGKTRTAINVAEQLKVERKTVVFLPGPALEDNFIQELQKFDTNTYSPKNKHWILKYDEFQKPYWTVDKNNTNFNYASLDKTTQKQINNHLRNIINDQYTIIRYNGISIDKLQNYIDNNILDNKFVIIDESHNIISMITNYLSNQYDETQNLKGRLFWKLFMNSINTKFVFLSGTPILNYPKELSAVFNIIQGNRIVYYYKILSTVDSNVFITYMKNFPYAEYINFVDNHLEIIPTPNNFKFVNNFLVKDNTSPNNHAKWLKLLKKYVSEFNNTHIITKNTSTKILNCFPIDDEFNELFIKNNNLINETVFLRRIVGCVSYYNDENHETNNNQYFPTITSYLDELEMSHTQYTRYQKYRLKEIKQDARKLQRNKQIFEDDGKDITTFKSRSLAICNFAWPLEMNYEEDIKNSVDIHENLYKRFKEIKTEQKLNKMFLELSPKYTKIINRMENSEGTNTIYSHLKNKEGLNAMFTMLRSKGWQEFKISFKNNEWTCTSTFQKTYFIYQDDIYKEYLKHIFNNDLSEIPNSLKNKLPHKTNLNGEIIKAMFITTSGAEGISLKNVRHLHIVEHHWSHIRIEQVIGRVKRFNSHIELPTEKRNISVYKYVTIFGNKLKKKLLSDSKNKIIFQSILNTDKQLTSDQCVINVANRKQQINNKLLECLKIASIDCFKNQKSKCYQINNNSYNPDYKKHIIDSKINIAPKIRLKQIALSDKIWIPSQYRKKIVLYDEINNFIYDKDSVRKGYPTKIALYIKKYKIFQIINDSD